MGRLSGKGEVSKALLKRMIDVCCLQEVRWKVLCFRMLGMEGRRCKPWWSGKVDGVDGVGVKVKEKVVEVGRMNDGMMAVMLVFEEDVLRMIYAYVVQCG